MEERKRWKIALVVALIILNMENCNNYQNQRQILDYLERAELMHIGLLIQNEKSQAESVKKNADVIEE